MPIGLRFDDLLIEEDDAVRLAVERLPEHEKIARQRRQFRAVDISLKKTPLPAEIQAVQEPFEVRQSPYRRSIAISNGGHAERARCFPIGCTGALVRHGVVMQSVPHCGLHQQCHIVRWPAYNSGSRLRWAMLRFPHLLRRQRIP